MSSLADLFAPGPSEARLHFVDESVVATLGSLWNQSEVVAAWSQARGCAPVAAALSNSSASITTLIGLVRAGPTLVSIPGPPRGADAERYKAFVLEAFVLFGEIECRARWQFSGLQQLRRPSIQLRRLPLLGLRL